MRYLFFLLVFSCLKCFSQIPTDNPYSGFITGSHWTERLKWKNVCDASSVEGLIGAGNVIDSVTIQRTIRKLSAEGGGVLYFPAGVYFFHSSLRLYSGVVIRGADLIGVTDAREAGYRPPTKFEFPRYIPKLTGGRSPGSLFKFIYADTTGIRNAGFVNLDINRATIQMFPGGYHLVHTLQGDTYWADFYHNNIIIFGVRQNNAAIPSPEVPSKIQIEKGHAWQLWPYRYIGNINVFVKANCVIANCRLNDEDTDDFDQPGYVDEMNNDFSGPEARFSYVDHPGICINAYKIVMRGGVGRASGVWGPYGVFRFNRQVNGFEDLDKESEYSYSFSGKAEIHNNYVLVKRSDAFISKGRGISIVDTNNKFVEATDSIQYLEHSGMRSSFSSSSASVRRLFEERSAGFGDGDTLKYEFLAPMDNDPGKKYPLILFLHSEDLYGTDNKKQLVFFVPLLCTEEVRKKFPCYIVAPQDSTLVPNSWMSPVNQENENWVPTAALVNADLLVDRLIKEKNVDPDRIYLIGLSRGGTAAWKLASRYPRKYASVVCLDGVEFPIRESELSVLKHIPFWTEAPEIYGYLDLFLVTRVNMVQLKQAGNTNAIFKLSGGHDRPEMVAEYGNDAEFLPWLFGKKRANELDNVAR